MKSQNVAILVLFTLTLILLYQVYFKTNVEQFFRFNSRRRSEDPINSSSSYITFDTLDSAYPSNILYPESLEDIQNAITDNPGQTIRASGDNYTFNNISLTDDIIVRTNKLKNIISLDNENKEICVESGCKIKDICLYLEDEGLALESIPEHIDQTIGSACSTASHGSNIDSGTMSDQIIDVIVVLANGHIRRVEFDDPEFPAYATNLGSLGIVYSITLRCVDNYLIHTTKKTGMWSSIKKNLVDWLDEYKFTQLTINPNSLRTTVVLRKKVSQSPSRNEKDLQHMAKDQKELPTEPYHNLLPQMPLRSNYTKSEVAVPYERTVDAIDDILKLCQSHKKISGYECDKDITVSFTGPDYNAWLSPASGRSSAWIQVCNSVPLKNTDKTNKFLQDYEDLLLYKYSGRPNWTTSKFTNAYKMRLLYGASIDYIRRVRERFDPEHRFTNNYISNIFD